MPKSKPKPKRTENRQVSDAASPKYATGHGGENADKRTGRVARPNVRSKPIRNPRRRKQ